MKPEHFLLNKMLSCEKLTERNRLLIRSRDWLHPKYFIMMLDKRAKVDLLKGVPLS